MTAFTVYDLNTGAVLSLIDIPDRPEWRNGYYAPGRALFRGALDPATQYVIGGLAVERPESQAACDRLQINADGEDVATIAGLPQSCVVSISGPVSATFDVDDGELQFTASIPGVYRISVEAFPVRRWEETIHAV